MTGRNPYVILGIPFGSSADVAHAAFTRRSKTLRVGTADYDAILPELTWALQRIESRGGDADADLDLYRIPADDGIFELSGPGVLAPRPEEPPGADSPYTARATHDLLRYLMTVRSRQIDLPLP
jgi:hypothetical protein